MFQVPGSHSYRFIPLKYNWPTFSFWVEEKDGWICEITSKALPKFQLLFLKAEDTKKQILTYLMYGIFAYVWVNFMEKKTVDKYIPYMNLMGSTDWFMTSFPGLSWHKAVSISTSHHHCKQPPGRRICWAILYVFFLLQRFWIPWIHRKSERWRWNFSLGALWCWFRTRFALWVVTLSSVASLRPSLLVPVWTWASTVGHHPRIFGPVLSPSLWSFVDVLFLPLWSFGRVLFSPVSYLVGVRWKNTCNWVVVHPFCTAKNEGPLVTTGKTWVVSLTVSPGKWKNTSLPLIASASLWFNMRGSVRILYPTDIDVSLDVQWIPSRIHS